MSNEVIKVLEYISDKLGIVVDWTSENVLPYAQEVIKRFILYKIVGNTITLTIGIILSIIIIIMVCRIIKSYLEVKKTRSENALFCYSKYFGRADGTGLGDLLITLSIILSITSIACLIIGACGLLNWSIIPEVQLLKEVQHILG